ncbi:MAG TPA: NADH-quinone oxidoreductase subunit NuoH [Anaerolineales bacterium]|jgi:NADH-quinone oxidoreductase subunit H|nr:NADH-quinone oxidoreductase subunit NuoH [Anaerolineales bacterium]
MGFDPVQISAEWLRNLFLGWGASEGLTEVLLKFIGAFLVATVVMLVFVLLTWVERKGAARFQDRIGPNRVGPFGLVQPIADALKMLTKEDTRPAGADTVSYVLAPIIAVFSVLMAWAVIPFTEKWIGADLSVGVLYIAAVGSFGIVSVMMAGWSSNNKYSLIGAFRGVAQLISYEVPLFLSLLVPVFLARSMGINSIVYAQGEGGVWFILMAPLAALIYFVSSMAEVGRAPFDLLEAESEIVAGYHIEYSGIKFGLFQAAEFLHSFTFAALMAILFFGGWRGPWADQYMLLGLVYFLIKTSIFYLVIIWSRLTFPRVRIDHLMNLNWKFMVPVSLILLMGMPLIDYATRLQDNWVRVVAQLGFNLVLGVVAFSLAAREDRRQNKRERIVFEGRPVAVMPKAPAPEEETAA